ncbi:putative stress enhanced protein 1, chloroplastic-like isoform X1 [Capsicum annuum]|nr:putative stress enhanced protein 1, chloroplastic-like isoform X1 [Capsicum annuum]
MFVSFHMDQKIAAGIILHILLMALSTIHKLQLMCASFAVLLSEPKAYVPGAAMFAHLYYLCSSSLFLKVWGLEIAGLIADSEHLTECQNQKGHDGTLLLSFKYSILDDPLSVLDNWEYNDATPCLWNGVTYAPDMIIQVLSLSNNDVNGVLPESVGGVKEPKGSKSFCQCICWKSAFVGNLPQKSSLQNLAVVSLRNNHFSGIVPSGFQFIEVLDLSSNFLNGTLPAEFGGDSLKYLTSFQTSLSGLVSSQFSKKIPPNATIDLSFNSLTAEIPESVALSNQKI